MQEFRLVGTVDIVSDDEDESTVIVNGRSLVVVNTGVVEVRNKLERSLHAPRTMGGDVHIGTIDVMSEVVAIGVARVEELVGVGDGEDDLD